MCKLSPMGFTLLTLPIALLTLSTFCQSQTEVTFANISRTYYILKLNLKFHLAYLEKKFLKGFHYNALFQTSYKNN